MHVHGHAKLHRAEVDALLWARRARKNECWSKVQSVVCVVQTNWKCFCK